MAPKNSYGNALCLGGLFLAAVYMLEHVREAKASEILPPALTDGYLVLCAVFAHQLDALLLPRQVLLAGLPHTAVGSISFVHGVPEASTVAGVTHAQDKRLRRTLLNMAGLPTPAGITFSSRGSKNLQEFVARNGYPLVLKEAIGENPSATVEVHDKAQLLKAISRLKKRSQDQLSPARSAVASAYAENMLNFSEDEEGNRIAPTHARLLIEKRIAGRYLRCLVLGTNIVATIERDNSSGWVEVSDRLHQDFRSVALRAAAVIPGLSVVSVDLVVEDPAKTPKVQKFYVVELSERPRLESYMKASPGLGPALADALLRYQAARAEVRLPAETDVTAVRMRAENLANPSALLPRFCDSCNALQLGGSIKLMSAVEGVVEGTIQGSPAAIALLTEALVSGIHFGQRATSVDIWQRPVENFTSFEVV